MYFSINFIAGKEIVSFERMTFIPRVGDTVLMPLHKTFKVDEVIYNPSTIIDGSTVVVIISTKL